MIKSLLLVSLLAAAFAYNEAPVLTLSQGPSVVTLEPGVTFTTGFNQYQIGSQFRIWIPNNASNITINWQKSANGAGCSSSAWAYLYGKWGTWPCASNTYNGLNELCEDRVQYGYSTNSPLVVQLNAYDSDNTDYWDSTNANDFLRGDWLYLASYIDLSNQNCTASINVSIDYCPVGTIVAEGPSSSGVSQCVAVTNVTSLTHTENVVATGPFDKFWLVHVPANASGVRASVNQTGTSASLYLYGRYSSAGIKYRYYSSYNNGNGAFSYYWANLPEGEFIVTVDTAATTQNINFDITIQVEICPPGFSADDYGNCTYPLTLLSSPYDLQTPITVDIPATNVQSDCNWRVYGFPIPAWTYSFFNISVTETAGSSSFANLRKNAWPTKNIYDDQASSSYRWGFTPEDLYINTTTWYYIGFCNPSNTEAGSWTLAAALQAVPSPSVTPSPSPVSPSATPSRSPSSSPSSSVSPTPSRFPSSSPALPSASSSPNYDSSSSSTSVSVLVLMLAVIVLVF